MHVGGAANDFAADVTLYEYDDESLRALLAASGFAIERIWTDSQTWFADSRFNETRRFP
jgi:uncharacterized SAM-dependent methyltransferase